MPTSANVTAWSQDHTQVTIQDDAGLFYHFQSSSGAELDFNACVSTVLAGTATAAAVNEV